MTLEDFYMQLKECFTEKFEELSEEKVKAITHLYYQVCYFSLNGKGKEEISKTLKMNLDFVELTLEMAEEDIKILESIIMRKFPENLESSGGILSDSANLDLLNQQLRTFHSKHNL